MTRVRFLQPDGTPDAEVTVAPGVRLLDAARLAGQPLEGTCGGQMACSTCHLIVEPAHFALLPRASEEEEDLLDLTPGAIRTSRLACQIVLTDDLADLVARRP